MKLKEKQKIINLILSGGFFCRISGKLYFIDKKISPMQKAEIDFEVFEQIAKYSHKEIPTEKQVLKKAIKNGDWNEEFETNLNKLNEDIKVFKNKYYDNFLNETIKRACKGSIGGITKKIYEIYGVKFNLVHNKTIESIEEKLKNRCKIIRMVKNSAGQVVDEEIVLKNKFYKELEKSLHENMISQEKIREIARTNPWRIMWNAGKSCVKDLFSVDISSFSDEQLELCYWSNFYDNVYEAYEKPDEDIINDDIALDIWFERQVEKQKREKIKEGLDKHNKKYYKEMYLKTDKTNKDKVYGMNDPMVRQLIQKRENLIKNSAQLSEKELVKKLGRINAALFVSSKKK